MESRRSSREVLAQMMCPECADVPVNVILGCRPGSGVCESCGGPTEGGESEAVFGAEVEGNGSGGEGEGPNYGAYCSSGSEDGYDADFAHSPGSDHSGAWLLSDSSSDSDSNPRAASRASSSGSWERLRPGADRSEATSGAWRRYRPEPISDYDIFLADASSSDHHGCDLSDSDDSVHRPLLNSTATRGARCFRPGLSYWASYLPSDSESSASNPSPTSPNTDSYTLGSPTSNRAFVDVSPPASPTSALCPDDLIPSLDLGSAMSSNTGAECDYRPSSSSSSGGVSVASDPFSDAHADSFFESLAARVPLPKSPVRSAVGGSDAGKGESELGGASVPWLDIEPSASTDGPQASNTLKRKRMDSPTRRSRRRFEKRTRRLVSRGSEERRDR